MAPDRTELADEPPADAAPDTPASRRATVIAWGRLQAATGQRRATELLERHRHRPVVDLGLRIYARDTEAAGSVVGSALALRLFLFFVPLLLFLVGLAGFVSTQVGPDDVESTGITGGLAKQINAALTQPSSTRWVAVALGVFGMATTGRALSRVLAVASCLAWRLPPRPKATVRAIGAMVGLIAGIGIVSTVVNRVRQEVGFGAATLSFLAALGIYLVAWILVLALLPKATTDPGALLPGALLLALTLTGLQAVSQLYLPDRVSQASELYGALGVVVVTLGWFFLMGRAIVLSLSLNAVIFERFGSISTFVFGLPVLRILPRRWAWFRRLFQLEV